jgi:hypothetical protein
MTDLIHLRCHRFDAFHALLVGGIRKQIAHTLMGSNHMRRDIGLPEAPTPGPRVDLTMPLVGLRR